MTDKLKTEPDFKGFADEIISNRFNGDLDGFDMQDLGIKYNLLKMVVVQEPCGDDCSCDDWLGEFPIECWRKNYGVEK